MPVCDGFEATRAIRLLEQQRTEDPANFQDQIRATIIALTGLASDADQKNAFLAGIDHFVTKPLRFKDLKALLEVWHIIPI
jgi:CheY-like chemotaxis protein